MAGATPYGGFPMAEFDRRYQTAVRSGAGARVGAIDQGLRAFMLGIYNNMAMGLALTGIVAYGAYTAAVGPSGLTAFGTRDLHEPAAVGDHARAARLRLRPVGNCEPHAACDGAARLPRLRGGDGPFDVVDLPGVHASEHRSDLLHHGRVVRRAEPLGLHDQARHFRLGLVPVHGRDRPRDRHAREHLPALARHSSSPCRRSAC